MKDEENRLTVKDEQECRLRDQLEHCSSNQARDDGSGALAVTVMASDRIMDVF